MAASRATWKGQLRLSPISVPVEVHSATNSGARVSFKKIYGPSGKRVRFHKTVSCVGPVKLEGILKGQERATTNTRPLRGMAAANQADLRRGRRFAWSRCRPSERTAQVDGGTETSFIR